MSRRWLPLLGLTLGLSLACAGGGSAPEGPGPTPTEPEPAPKKPAPAPNADRCEGFQGGSLPLEGGVIIECSPRKVVIDHAGGEALKLRWEYANHYKSKGWTQGDPKKGNPTVVKYPDTLVFKAGPSLVTIELDGQGGRP